MSVAIAAHAVGKDAQLYCLLSAVGLRNAAGSDIVTCLMSAAVAFTRATITALSASVRVTGRWPI